MSARLSVLLAGLLGASGVAAGAMGAHLLEKRLEPEQLEIFITGTTYQMYHAVALLALGGVLLHGRGVCSAIAGWSFFLGTLLFSGSLYVYILTGSEQKWLVAITPFGGTILIIGWLALLGHACCCWPGGPRDNTQA